jgi:carbon-monoxide dehydrogenase large subunit
MSAIRSLVVAETLAEARAAAGMVDVDYEVLPAVVDTATADKAKSSVHDAAPDNVCFVWGAATRRRPTQPSRRLRMSRSSS